MSGWFAISKGVWDDPIWGEKTPMTEREAYLWLCRNAAYEDTKHRVGNEMIDCPKGSLFITLRDFMTTTSWGSDTKIRDFLLRLEKAGLIKRTTYGKRNARKTHVTICEYTEKSYAGDERNAPKTHRERTKNAVNKEENNKQEEEDTNVSLSGSRKSPLPANDLSQAIATYNAAAAEAGWPQVQRLTPPRSKHLRARLADGGGLDGWETAVAKARASDFCCGRTSKPWTSFSFDWLIKLSNFTKLMEGNYDNRTGNSQNRGGGGSGSGMVDAFATVALLHERG